MLNDKQITPMLGIGLVAVLLMVSASTRVFAAVATQVNNVLQTDENKIAADEHAIDSKITSHERSPPVSVAVDASGGFK